MHLQSVFFAFAVVGGTFFVLRSVSLFAGFGVDEAAAGGADGADFDGGAADVGDAAGPGDADGSPAGDFRLFTLNGLVSFAFLFGLTGWLLLRDGVAGPVAASVAAVAVGTFAMWATGWIFSGARKLQTDGTVRIADAVGADGEVYLAIRPGKAGQVRVVARGQSKIFDARASDPAEDLPTGTPVRVLSADTALVVARK